MKFEDLFMTGLFGFMPKCTTFSSLAVISPNSETQKFKPLSKIVPPQGPGLPPGRLLTHCYSAPKPNCTILNFRPNMLTNTKMFSSATRLNSWRLTTACVLHGGLARVRVSADHSARPPSFSATQDSYWQCLCITW